MVKEGCTKCRKVCKYFVHGFFDYFQSTDDVFENLEYYNSTKEKSTDDLCDTRAYMVFSKTLKPIIYVNCL